MIAVNREQRLTAMHECAHAVVHSFGGARIVGLALHHPDSDIAGECKPSYPLRLMLPVHWHKTEHCYWINTEGWRAMLTQHPPEELRHLVRSLVCGLLAGRIMESVENGGPTWKPKKMRQDEQDDVLRAQALARLLCEGDAEKTEALYSQLAKQTLAVLRTSEVRGAVGRLADALLTMGSLGEEQIQSLLPSAPAGWLK